MKQSEAKEMLPIIQAWADGKTIQYKEMGVRWSDVLSNELLDFSRSASHYRIKPEPRKPRVIWVNEYPSGLACYTSMSEQVANANALPSRISCRKFVEVVEDEQ